MGRYYYTKEGKYSTKAVELVGFGDWGNGGWRKSIFENDCYVSRLCHLVDNAKVNQEWANKRKAGLEDHQDGGGVRRGDHLPPHKYIRNTSTCGTTPTEHLLNAGRRPQTFQKERKSPSTWVEQKKKEKTETKE